MNRQTGYYFFACVHSYRYIIYLYISFMTDLEESAADCDKEEPEGFEERHFCTFITTVTDKILT